MKEQKGYQIKWVGGYRVEYNNGHIISVWDSKQGKYVTTVVQTWADALASDEQEALKRMARQDGSMGLPMMVLAAAFMIWALYQVRISLVGWHQDAFIIIYVCLLLLASLIFLRARGDL